MKYDDVENIIILFKYFNFIKNVFNFWVFFYSFNIIIYFYITKPIL